MTSPSIASVLRSCTLAILVATWAPAPVLAAPVAPHSARYQLSLAGRPGDSVVRAVQGQLETRVEVSCDGYTSQQYVGFTLVVDDGTAMEHLSRLRTFEAADGSELIFTSETWEDREQVEELRGVVRRGAQGVTLRYTTPSEPARTLPSRVRFPMTHAGALLDAARAGHRQLRGLVFDGSARENPFEVAAAIGPRRVDDGDAPEALRGQAYWPVRLAYFLPGDSDPTPRFQMGIHLYESGIAGNMLFDYGGFAMQVVLEELTIDAEPRCPH